MEPPASATTARAAESAETRRHRALPTYTLAETELGMGASLGNARVWVNTKSTGAIERVFCIEHGSAFVSAVSIRYAGTGNPLHAMWAGRHREAGTYVQLQRDLPAYYDLHPVFQRRRFTLAGMVSVSETVFVPLRTDELDDPPLVYQSVELRNSDDVVHDLRLLGFAHLRGTLPADVEGRYVSSIDALVARNASRPDAVRVFGLSTTPTAVGTTMDFGNVYDRSHVHQLDGTTNAAGDILGALQYDVALGPQQVVRVAFVTGVFVGSEEAAIDAYRAALEDPDDALRTTIAYVDELVQTGEVLTPDPAINAGALWSKVNMRRVMASYPQGRAFTNEPGVSSNIVMRDAAWFVIGNDHFMPAFSRELVARFERAQYSSGKLPEYYNGLTGTVEDDGLNINDGTPLYVFAVIHHWRATGDDAWLRSIYPSVQRAARYIISQCDERGLVFCSANDPRGNVWAIASWRNVIPLYAINGAVTEINAECAAALGAAAQMARAVQDTPGSEDFAAGAARIRAAMDAHLRNPDNGLYYLNIDTAGNAHTDVTGDEIFPVMFQVCDEETGYRIISRLNAPDFWTPAGLRTVSRGDPLYDPAGNVGLLGGVWPGLTWWYAFAAGRYHPEFMVDGLRASFQHYAAAPKLNNTVPGQFSEWFDGESLINRGMRLSPWEPPRFLWAAIEGVCGLSRRNGILSVRPLIPASWRWIALRREPNSGAHLSYFVVRRRNALRIYSTADMETEHEHDRYDEDVSWAVSVFSNVAVAVALRRPGQSLILVGNCGETTMTAPLNIRRLVDQKTRYSARIYNSEREAWENEGVMLGADISTLAITVECGGYRLIELRQAA